METDRTSNSPSHFESEDAFLSFSGVQPQLSVGPSWLPIFLGILSYVILGFLDRYIPNPMLPGASVALAMVIPIVSGALFGIRAGALVGLLGTAFLVAAEFPFFGVNFFEVTGLIVHPLMGALAGFLATRSRHQIVPGLAVLFGHILNLSLYISFGLISITSPLARNFLLGLLAETALDLILFSVIMSLIQIARGLAGQGISRRRAMWAWSSVILLLAGVTWAHLQGVSSIEPLMVLPVALAAVLLGPLAAWVSALVPTTLLAVPVIRSGLEMTQREVVMILALNLVALILGELAAGLRRHGRMARRRAAILAAISHSAEQVMEHEDWEAGLPDVLQKLGQAAGSRELALYQLEGKKLNLHSQSAASASLGLPTSIETEELSPEFARGKILAGAPHKPGLSGVPQCLLLPVRSSSSLTGALLVMVPRERSPWTSAVRDALRVAADLLGAALHRREAEAALVRSEERYALAAQGVKDGLWDWDLESGEIYFSDRWYEMLGASREKQDDNVEFWLQLVDAEDRPLLERRVNDHIRGASEQLEVEYRIRHRDGSLRWMLCRGIATRNEAGRATRMAGSQTDITERKETEEQIRRDAFFDRLTGLPNRALLVDRLRIACQRAGRSETPGIGLILADIDRLKLVNDSLGHRAADELIRQLAERLEGLAGPERTVARMGGDDFAILVEEEDPLGVAQKIERRIVEDLRRAFVVEGQEIYLTLSLGIARCFPGDRMAEHLLQDADIALSEAKARGRAQTVIFEAGMRDSNVQRLSLETELRRALVDDQLRLFYQPIVRLNDGELTGFEALLRWNNPHRGLMGPGEFISVAEGAGLVVSLGEWALLEACESLKTWWRDFPDRHVTTSVNLHSHQFRQHDLVELVSATLSRLEIPSESLRLEVTEQAMMEDQRFAVDVMEELCRLGIHLYIDDFGTGYSSLGYLIRLPVSTLKIDQSFIIGMEEDPRKRQMVEAILQLARTLELEVVAEGIEKPEHLDFLKKRGCRYGQGFLFARPMPLAEATELIASGWRFPSADTDLNPHSSPVIYCDSK